jgi:hypothetical protein
MMFSVLQAISYSDTLMGPYLSVVQDSIKTFGPLLAALAFFALRGQGQDDLHAATGNLARVINAQ